MIKRILLFLIVSIVLFLVSYFSHSAYLDNNFEISPVSIPLVNVYIFNLISCILIYLLIEVFLTILPNETGYLYLALTMIKMGVFLLIFQSYIFSENPISNAEKTILVLPFLLFLFLEAFAIGVLINRYNPESEKTLEKKL